MIARITGSPRTAENFSRSASSGGSAAAATAAGIGWGITCWDPSCGRLVNFTVESHQLGAVWGAVPIIALDCWEHAFYHDYGPDKGKYLDVFFQNLHWGRIDERFRAAGGQ